MDKYVTQKDQKQEKIGKLVEFFEKLVDDLRNNRVPGIDVEKDEAIASRLTPE